MLPAHVDTTAVVKGVAAAIAATSALWVAKASGSPRPRSVSDASWAARTDAMELAAPRQAAREPVLMNPFRRPVV
jgi:hypothetical protein